MDVTILELHLPGAEFNAPFAGGSAAEPAESEPEADDDGGRGSLLPVLLVVLGLAALAWYRRRSEGGTQEL